MKTIASKRARPVNATAPNKDWYNWCNTGLLFVLEELPAYAEVGMIFNPAIYSD